MTKHETSLFVVALAMFFLNMFDATFTMHHVMAYGMDNELNPVMRSVLEKGLTYFFVMKMTLIGLCIALLIQLKNEKLFKIISGKQLLVCGTMGYAILIGYELTMLVGGLKGWMSLVI